MQELDRVALLLFHWSLCSDLRLSLKLSQTCKSLLSQLLPRHEWLRAMVAEFEMRPVANLLVLAKTPTGQIIAALAQDDPELLASCLGETQPRPIRSPFAYRKRCIEWCLQRGLQPFWIACSFEEVLQLVKQHSPAFVFHLFDDTNPPPWLCFCKEQVFQLLDAGWFPTVGDGRQPETPKTIEEAKELVIRFQFDGYSSQISGCARDALLWMEEKFQLFSNPEIYNPEFGFFDDKERHSNWLYRVLSIETRLLESTVALLVKTLWQAEWLAAEIDRQYQNVRKSPYYDSRPEPEFLAAFQARVEFAHRESRIVPKTRGKTTDSVSYRSGL